MILYFLRLGTIGFGGPVALAGYMQRDLVDNHKWLSQDEYLEGLAVRAGAKIGHSTPRERGIAAE